MKPHHIFLIFLICSRLVMDISSQDLLGFISNERKKEQTVPSRDFFFLLIPNISVDITLCFVSFSFSPQHPSCLFFQYNTQLGPPYHILVDTNFINFSIKAKLDLVQSMMDCLYAKCEYQTFPFLWHLYRIIILIQIHEKRGMGF